MIRPHRLAHRFGPAQVFMLSATLAATALAVGASPGALAAQGGPPANITLAPADVVFPSPTDIDFDGGWVDHGGISVTVEPRNQRRQNWQLFVQASAADMGGYGKPVQDILVRAEGGAWMALGTTTTLVAEGTGPTTVTLFFRLLLDWTLDEPGVYSVPVEYSVTSF